MTVESFRSRTLPEEELLDACARLGGGLVAVRSSATAEDLPHASVAGPQDTYLDVEGSDQLIDAVRRSRDSLYSARAVAYRTAAGIDDAAMAAVVQRMVDHRRPKGIADMRINGSATGFRRPLCGVPPRSARHRDDRTPNSPDLHPASRRRDGPGVV